MRKLSVALCLGLVAGLVPGASASHPTQMCLDVDPDRASPMSNDDIVDSIWAYPGATDDDHPSRYEGCGTELSGQDQDWGGNTINFEITGVGDPDDPDSNSPETPDLTCTIAQGAGGCSVQPPSSAGGEQTIRAWINNDGTTQPDMAEGYDEVEEPGDEGEPDRTDVALWMWTHGDPPPAPCGNDDVCWGRVTIDLERGKHNYQFLGEIRREDGSCGWGEVSLWKKRPGRDRRVADALTSKRSWEVVFDHPVKGRFYAKLSRTQTESIYTNWPRYTCAGDRSPVLRVD